MSYASKNFSAIELQSEIIELAKTAEDHKAAVVGSIAATLAITIRIYGPIVAVEKLRDIAALIEHEMVLPAGEVLQ